MEAQDFGRIGHYAAGSNCAATRNGAEVIGILDEVGTIEPRKLADLLILKANPLADIENARQIEWGFHGGTPNRREAFVYPE